jgi:glutamate carboxypeptidase
MNIYGRAAVAAAAAFLIPHAPGADPGRLHHGGGTTRALHAQTISATERRIVDHVEANADAAIDLLERTVNINSGTFNVAGVRRVGEVMAAELRPLGFEVRWAELPDSLGRAGHLVAERRGTQGRRVLLIGHLDTVFEEDDPSQRFTRIDERTATGPGVIDMKGGNVAIVHALKALHAAGALEDRTITVVLTGDEEDPGIPLAISRRDLIDAARRSDVALSFEAGSRDVTGDFAVIARRSAYEWRLRVWADGAHSSGIFNEGAGHGAIFEAARIISAFYDELRGEQYLTFSPGLIVGGTEATFEADAARGTAFGKTNVIPAAAMVTGDLRTISDEQAERTRQRMRDIVARNLPGTRAEITFLEGYPSMPPTEGNRAVLGMYELASRDLGYGPVHPFDPGRRGAGDISFIAAYVDALDGLGPQGAGSHTDQERIDLASLPIATKRAALLIYRLTR